MADRNPETSSDKIIQPIKLDLINSLTRFYVFAIDYLTAVTITLLIIAPFPADILDKYHIFEYIWLMSCFTYACVTAILEASKLKATLAKHAYRIMVTDEGGKQLTPLHSLFRSTTVFIQISIGYALFSLSTLKFQYVFFCIWVIIYIQSRITNNIFHDKLTKSIA